jgi:hypothetical protein
MASSCAVGKLEDARGLRVASKSYWSIAQGTYFKALKGWRATKA